MHGIEPLQPMKLGPLKTQMERQETGDTNQDVESKTPKLLEKGEHTRPITPRIYDQDYQVKSGINTRRNIKLIRAAHTSIPRDMKQKENKELVKEQGKTKLREP